MGLIHAALRRPITVLIAVLGVVLASLLALHRMSVDIFPALNEPVIYVAQPYGGMSPAQMEGYLVYYYEYNFLYISGIQTVESKSIQSIGLLKLTFLPGTDMNQALAQTVAYVERARIYAGWNGSAFCPTLRCRQCAGRRPHSDQPFAQCRGAGRSRAPSRAPAVCDPARRFRAAAVRRQPAHHRDPCGSGASALLPHVCG